MPALTRPTDRTASSVRFSRYTRKCRGASTSSWSDSWSVSEPPMSAGPAALAASPVGSPQLASSSAIVGIARLGAGSLIAEGVVIRSADSRVEVGTRSAVLDNSVLVGNPSISVHVGRRSVFGHRCLVIGATVGDLCEIGNGSILLPGARIGDRVFLGEGTLVAAGTTLPSDV